MKLLTASAFAVGVSLMAMSASQAMPLAPLDQTVSSDTIRVAGGCGPGWHRGPYGGCRPMFNCPPAFANIHFARNASNSSLNFSGASRNTRCPAFGSTSALASGILPASALASSAFWPIFGRIASGAFGLPGAL